MIASTSLCCNSYVCSDPTLSNSEWNRQLLSGFDLIKLITLMVSFRITCNCELIFFDASDFSYHSCRWQNSSSAILNGFLALTINKDTNKDTFRALPEVVMALWRIFWEHWKPEFSLEKLCWFTNMTDVLFLADAGSELFLYSCWHKASGELEFTVVNPKRNIIFPILLIFRNICCFFFALFDSLHLCHYCGCCCCFYALAMYPLLLLLTNCIC